MTMDVRLLAVAEIRAPTRRGTASSKRAVLRPRESASPLPANEPAAAPRQEAAHNLHTQPIRH